MATEYMDDEDLTILNNLYSELVVEICGRFGVVERSVVNGKSSRKLLEGLMKRTVCEFEMHC